MNGANARAIYEFGPFWLDPIERRLSVNGNVLPLTPKAFDTLLTLLSAAGTVVTKSEFRRTGFTEAHLRGSVFTGWSTVSVLVEHCLRSNGGLWYADRDEFIECLKLLVGDARLRQALGRNGREYVRRNYRWDVVLGKFERLFARIRNAR